MKTNELMVGDWVLISVWDCNPFPSKVTSINYNSYQGKDFVDWIDTEYEEDIEMYAVQPIPLTPEILEKNGFLVGYKQGSITYYHIGWDFYLDLDGGEILLKIRRDCDFTFFGIISCKYVHELQHALRLCGIDKEIVL